MSETKAMGGELPIARLDASEFVFTLEQAAKAFIDLARAFNTPPPKTKPLIHNGKKARK